MFNKFFSWLSYFLDYLAAVLIFISLNKFFWVSKFLDGADLGIGLFVLVLMVLLSMLVIFAMVFWHDNKVLNSKLAVKNPCMLDHFLQSLGFYIALVILSIFFVSSDFFTVVTFVPILVTFLAILTNAYYLYRLGGGRTWLKFLDRWK